MFNSFKNVLQRELRLKAIHKALDRQQKISVHLKDVVPPAFKEYVRCGQLKEGELCVIVPNSGVAAQLGYHTKKILTELNHALNPTHIKSLRFKLDPRLELSKTPAKAVQFPFTILAIDSLNETANNLEDPRLKSALSKLAAQITKRLTNYK